MMIPKTTFVGLACLISASYASLIRIPHVQTTIIKPTVVVMPRLGRPMLPVTNIRVVNETQQAHQATVPTTFVRDVVDHGAVCYDETDPLPLNAFNMTAKDVTPTANAIWLLPNDDDGYLHVIRASLDAESWDDTNEDNAANDNFLSPASASPSSAPFNWWYCLVVVAAALIAVSVWFVAYPPEWYYYVLTEDNTWEPRVSRAVLEQQYQEELEYEERVRQQEEFDEAARKQSLPLQHECYYRATTPSAPLPTAKFQEIMRQQDELGEAHRKEFPELYQKLGYCATTHYAPLTLPLLPGPPCAPPPHPIFINYY